MTKKMVLTLQVYDEKQKQKALKAVSSLPGIESLAMDMGERKLTVVGDVDPIQIVRKLRKYWHTEIVTVGPAEEKEADKKDDQNKEEIDQIHENKNVCQPYYPHSVWQPYYPHCYSVCSAEENPNSSVIWGFPFDPFSQYF